VGDDQGEGEIPLALTPPREGSDNYSGNYRSFRIDYMISVIPSGNITSASGFLAGAVHAGIKGKNELDLAIVWSEVTCKAAGVFTTSQIKSAPII
jgi:hypothetical protein